eukprot:8942470-Prorocentrum_lima.AAC.1
MISKSLGDLPWQQHVVVYGDGSGGAHSSYPVLRRCGWAWVTLNAKVHLEISSGMAGTLAGHQSVPRAEIQAFIQAAANTKGPFTYYTDAAIVVKGWDTC